MIKVGVLVANAKCNISGDKISTMLFDKGYELGAVLSYFDKESYDRSVAYLKEFCNTIIICGNTEQFFNSVADRFVVDPNRNIFELDNVYYAITNNLDENFLSNSVIPMLNSQSKTLYTTAVFRTFGKSEEELKEILKDYIKNRNRIIFSFTTSECGCDVRIRYSSKMSKINIDETVAAAAELLKDYVYSVEDTALNVEVAKLLKLQNKRLKIAESFTGGALGASFTAKEGASKFLMEDLITYSNNSKIHRLNVERQIIDNFGAVSIETCYEMAANLMLDGDCDLVVATTGNAGPTAEKEGDVGLCFIAVGDRNGIHIYQFNFSGDRKSVISDGVNNALFLLYKKLKQEDVQLAER